MQFPTELQILFLCILQFQLFYIEVKGGRYPKIILCRIEMKRSHFSTYNYGISRWKKNIENQGPKFIQPLKKNTFLEQFRMCVAANKINSHRTINWNEKHQKVQLKYHRKTDSKWYQNPTRHIYILNWSIHTKIHTGIIQL